MLYSKQKNVICLIIVIYHWNQSTLCPFCVDLFASWLASLHHFPPHRKLMLMFKSYRDAVHRDSCQRAPGVFRRVCFQWVTLWRCDVLEMCLWCFCVCPRSSWSVHRSHVSFSEGGNPFTNYWFKEIQPGDWRCGAFRRYLPYSRSHPLQVQDSLQCTAL